MQHHRETVKKGPNAITFIKTEVSAAFRGNESAQLGSVGNADNILGIHLASGDACYNATKSIFSTAFSRIVPPSLT